MDVLRPKRIDRSGLLANPMFWAAHLLENTGGEHAVDLFFDVSPSDYDKFWKKEFKDSVVDDAGAFPSYCFALPLPNGCLASVEWEACPGDFGIAYYIHHPKWDNPLLLCRYPSAYDWPPFRWAEAVMIADCIREHAGHPKLHQAAMPLLFPGVWLTPEDDLDLVRSRLRSDWRELGVARVSSVDLLVSATIAATVRTKGWWWDGQFGWINNGHSLRNPKNSGPEFFGMVKEFWSAVSMATGNEGNPFFLPGPPGAR
jgi:hypothetical protein